MLRNQSIKTKLISISALSSTIALCVFSGILFFYETEFVKKEIISNLQTQVEIISENSLASLAFMDDSTTRKTLGALKHNPDILYAGLYDTKQQLLADYRKDTYQQPLILSDNELIHAPHLIPTDDFIQLIQPVELNHELLGYLVLRASFDSFDKKLQDYRTIILLTFSITLMIALYLSIYTQRIVSRPIIRIAKFIQHITKSKSYNIPIVKESEDELGRLADAFNEMLQQLNTSFKERDVAEKTLSHNLRNLQAIVDEKTADLQKALQIADAANQAKSDFLANMSHEIRTPMNAILGMLHLAQHTELTQKQQNYLDKIDTSCQLLLMLIDDILDFSKVEAGKLDFESTAFSLDSVLTHLIDSVKIKAEQKNIPVSLTVSTGIPKQLVGDSLRLGQILLNLVSNAVKFTDEGDVAIHVDYKMVSEKEVLLYFSVCDTGIGINPAQLETLFQPFSQADTSITRKYGGSGLGLVICKQLVELMNGKIEIVSELGKGSTFTFNVTLPIAPLQPIKPTKNKKKITFQTNHNYNARRILLVEDNEINQQVAVEILSTIGLEVTLANNGKEGLDLALAESFDLILMDVQMPIMDGLTATRLIRQEEKLKYIPIVAMTAHAMRGDKEKSLAAGMNDHLTKPIMLDKLVEVLNQWLHINIEIVATPELSVDALGILPKSLPPFDLMQALVFSNHNSTLLHSLLLNFGKRFVNAPTQLREYIQLQKFNEAAQLAHSIKGVAGTLAAHDLKNAASTLESELRAGEFDRIDEQLNDLTDKLEFAITSANTLPPVVENSGSNVSLTTNEFENLLAQLQTALRGNNFKATEIFTQLKSYLLSQNLEREVSELTASLEQLDFKNALSILEHVNFLLEEKNAQYCQ